MMKKAGTSGLGWDFKVFCGNLNHGKLRSAFGGTESASLYIQDDTLYLRLASKGTLLLFK